MAREVSVGKQSFADMRENDYFLVDKTAFVRDWWRGGDDVTLICRPRRFGKTLTLSMVECFLSLDYAGRGEELFGGMDVWDDADMRGLQGTVPVVSLSFADVKRPTLDETLADVKAILRVAVRRHAYLLDSDAVDESDRRIAVNDLIGQDVLDGYRSQKEIEMTQRMNENHRIAGTRFRTVCQFVQALGHVVLRDHAVHRRSLFVQLLQ